MFDSPRRVRFQHEEATPPRRLLYYCPSTIGGIVDYAWAQAAALAESGIDLTMLTASSAADTPGNLKTALELRDDSQRIEGPRVLRWFRIAQLIRVNILQLCRYIEQYQFRHVLMATYLEYGAPVWTGPLRALRASGVRFGAIVHDPVRDYVVGPEWFHKWSVRCGYSFLDDAFVHENLDHDRADIPEHVGITVIPHGPYTFPTPVQSGMQLRERLGIPVEAKVVLAFGQVRDGKNLDLVIRALAHFPDLWLLVAGKEAGGVQRPVTFYQQIAEACGVAERCRWCIDYVSPEHVRSYFDAADLVLLTYSSRFRSASGVLNAAVQARRLCLASSGDGPLRTQVERHRLGIWIEPDSQDALIAGLRAWTGGLTLPDWSGYLEENSWRRNADVVVQKMFS